MPLLPLQSGAVWSALSWPAHPGAQGTRAITPAEHPHPGCDALLGMKLGPQGEALLSQGDPKGASILAAGSPPGRASPARPMSLTLREAEAWGLAVQVAADSVGVTSCPGGRVCSIWGDTCCLTASGGWFSWSEVQAEERVPLLAPWKRRFPCSVVQRGAPLLCMKGNPVCLRLVPGAALGHRSPFTELRLYPRCGLGPRA